MHFFRWICLNRKICGEGYFRVQPSDWIMDCDRSNEWAKTWSFSVCDINWRLWKMVQLNQLHKSNWIGWITPLFLTFWCFPSEKKHFWFIINGYIMSCSKNYVQPNLTKEIRGKLSKFVMVWSMSGPCQAYIRSMVYGLWTSSIDCGWLGVTNDQLTGPATVTQTLEKYIIECFPWFKSPCSSSCCPPEMTWDAFLHSGVLRAGFWTMYTHSDPLKVGIYFA